MNETLRGERSPDPTGFAPTNPSVKFRRPETTTPKLHEFGRSADRAASAWVTFSAAVRRRAVTSAW